MCDSLYFSQTDFPFLHSHFVISYWSVRLAYISIDCSELPLHHTLSHFSYGEPCLRLVILKGVCRFAPSKSLAETEPFSQFTCIEVPRFHFLFTVDRYGKAIFEAHTNPNSIKYWKKGSVSRISSHRERLDFWKSVLPYSVSYRLLKGS